jgi:2-keto-4-pentenoate hydratase
LKAYAMGLDVASQLRFPLGAGSILLAGAATAAITLKVGRLEVTVEGLGSVAIQVTD